jgi:hypothetical protein
VNEVKQGRTYLDEEYHSGVGFWFQRRQVSSPVYSTLGNKISKSITFFGVFSLCGGEGAGKIKIKWKGCDIKILRMGC